MEPSTEARPTATDSDYASEKNDMKKCKHFSMRKYVSEMRQKDVQKCWPLKLDYIHSGVPKDVLPPLDVPKYRWWRCSHCLPEFWATATDAENGAVPHACCAKCKFGGPFDDAMNLRETATVASGFQLMVNLDIADVKESNPTITLEISPKRGNTSVLDVVKRDEAVQNNLEIIKETGADSGRGQPADNYATQGSNFREHPTSCYKGTGSLTAENALETVEVEEKAIDRKATEACENKAAGLIGDFVGGENGVAPAGPDLRDSPSSHSSEVGPYMTGGFRRRKARKMRLLTDLLAAVNDTRNKHIRKDNAPLLAICDVTEEMRKHIVAEEEVENYENTKKVGLKNKRMLDSENSIKCSDGVPKVQEKENPSALTVFGKNSEVILDSPSEGDSFARIHSQSSNKNNLPEHVDVASNSIRKKKKKSKVNGNLSEMKPPSAETKHTLTSSNGKEFSCREVGIMLSSAPEARKNSITRSLQEKTNLPPLRPDQEPVISLVLPSCLGRPLERMGFEVEENNPASEKFWSAKPSSAGNGSYLLSKTSSNVSFEADRPNSEVRESCSVHGMGDPPSRHRLDSHRSNGIYEIGNDGIDRRIQFLSDRQQRYAPNMMDSDCFWSLKLGILGATKKKKSIKRQENTTVMPQCHDKSANPGNPDDIPMEIVELMAKHQFERRLQNAEKDNGQNLLLKENSQKRKFPENIPDGVASKDFRPSAQSFDVFSDLGANNYKMDHLDRYHNPPLHRMFFQDQGFPPKFQPVGGSSLADTPQSMTSEDYSHIKASDGNFLSLGVSGMWYPPKHNEAPVPRLSSMRPDCMPFVYSIMPQSCGLHSNGMDFQPHGPKTPPKVEMNCCRDPKCFTRRANCLQKAEEDFNFKADQGVMKDPYNSRPNGADYERGDASLDISSNETIPAMHLLSLMDAGMCSGKNIRSDEDARLGKRPSLPCECHSKEGCGLHVGMCKAYVPLGRPSFDYNQANVPPAFSPSASSSQTTNLFRTGSDGKSYVPLDVHDKEKGKCYEIRQHIGSSRVLSFLANSACPESSYGFKPYHSKERNIPGSSEARITLPFQRMPGRDTIGARNGIHMIQQPRSCPDAAICRLNRNPAEFSVPEDGNVYSIGRDDLKLVRRIRNKPKSSNARCHGGKKMTKANHASDGCQNLPQIA